MDQSWNSVVSKSCNVAFFTKTFLYGVEHINQNYVSRQQNCWTVCLHPFVSNAPFLYPLKTSENRKVFRFFQGVGKGCMGTVGLSKTKCGYTTNFGLAVFSKYALHSNINYSLCSFMMKVQIKFYSGTRWIMKYDTGMNRRALWNTSSLFSSAFICYGYFLKVSQLQMFEGWNWPKT